MGTIEQFFRLVATVMLIGIGIGALWPLARALRPKLHALARLLSPYG